MSTKPTTEQNKILTPVQKATKALLTATAGLEKVLSEANALPAIADDLDQAILVKKQEQADLTKIVTDGRRDAEADLAILIKEDTNKVLTSLMKDAGLAGITQSALNDLSDELEVAKADVEAKISAGIAAAVNTATRDHRHGMEMLESAHKQETASLQAHNAQLIEKNNFLLSQLEEARQARKDDQANQVAIAEANSKSAGVVVNS